MTVHADPIQDAAQGPDVPPGFEGTASGLVVPIGTQAYDRQTWPTAKVDLLDRLMRWAAAEHLTVHLACSDPRCAERPVLRRVELPDGRVALVCPHAIRLCATTKHQRRARRQRGMRRRAGVRVRTADVE